MGYKAYLQRGTAKLDLDTSPYDIAFGFVPPAVTETPNIGTGTSANQYGGGKLISKRTEPGAYSFSVRIMGNSNAHNEALVDRLDRFIRSGTEAEPVYFCWRPADNVDAEPLYGQWNATRRAKVITGSVYKSAAYYGVYSVRDTVIFADVNMIINPPEGKRQRVATAKGGIMEDTFGVADGTSRGVIVSPATTNVINNPVFGNATYSTGWNTGSDLIGASNSDSEFVLYGSTSVKLVRKTSGSAFSFYQSINVGNTNAWTLSFYAKKSDGSAVTSADIQPRYSSTTYDDGVYQAIGNGWYRVWKSVTGIASAEFVGCTVILAGQVIYIDGVQFEERGFPTALTVGDMLGCTWSGTAHASFSTRAVASLKIPAAECIQPSNFTWWMAFRANNNFASLGANAVLLWEETSNAAIYAGTNGQVTFSDGTNGANGVATAIAAGDIVIVHATMSSAGLKLYRNGAADGAGNATFVPIASSAQLWIGTNDLAAGHANVTILGAGTYNRALTAAEIALDYANMLQAARGMDGYGGRVDWVPYLYTKDGDNVVDNCDDATRDNWAVVASVPGSVAAKTEWKITPETPYPTSYLVHQPMKTFVIPNKQTFEDFSGTAVADACGGEVIDLTGPTDSVTSSTLVSVPKEFSGNIHMFVRALHSTGPDTGYMSIIDATAPPVTFADDTTYNLYYMGSIRLEYTCNDLVTPVPKYWKTSGGTEYLDYMMAIPGYCLKIDNPGSTAEYFSIVEALVYNPENYTVNLTGDVINVLSGRLNVMYYLQGSTSTESVVASTATFNSIYITPRWAMA